MMLLMKNHDLVVIVDIPEPFINVFRKRIRDVPLHFDYANLQM